MRESHFPHLATLATEVHQNTFITDSDGRRLVGTMLDVISADPASLVQVEEWSNLVEIEMILASVPGNEAVGRRSRLRHTMADRAYEELATYWSPGRTEATSAADFDDWDSEGDTEPVSPEPPGRISAPGRTAPAPTSPEAPPDKVERAHLNRGADLVRADHVVHVGHDSPR